MPVPNGTFTEMVTTTLREHPNEISDNVSNHNALYDRLVKKGKIKKTTDGGYEIVRPLDYEENSTYQRYSGWDNLNISPSEVLSAAKYDWVQASISIAVSGRELRMNNSKEKIIDLVKAKKRNALRTAANNMAVDLYSTGSLTNQMGGLAHIIQANGQGTVGGINAATFPFWQNKSTELAGADDYVANPGVLKKAMHAQWLQQCRGTDKPDIVVSTHDLYTAYWESLTDLQRYRNEDTPDTFQNLKFQSADVMFDNNDNFTATGETMYFLNTEYLELCVHADATWTALPTERPVNQDGEIVTLIWQGQLTCSNRSLQGGLYDAA